MIADYLARTIVDPVFGAAGRALGAPRCCSAIYAYAVQIYCDFSGYTDIAIGLALLLGFELPAELQPPVPRASAPGLLAALAHDAVALAARLPLHPARRQPRRAARRPTATCMLTMLLGGLWHGAAWTFVIWGALHGRPPRGERWSAGAAAARGLPSACRRPRCVQGAAVVADLQRRLLRLGLLPGRSSPPPRTSSAACSPAGARRPRRHALLIWRSSGDAGVAVRAERDPRHGHRAVLAARAGRCRSLALGVGLVLCSTPRPRRHRPVHLLPVLTAWPPRPDPHRHRAAPRATAAGAAPPAGGAGGPRHPRGARGGSRRLLPERPGPAQDGVHAAGRLAPRHRHGVHGAAAGHRRAAAPRQAAGGPQGRAGPRRGRPHRDEGGAAAAGRGARGRRGGAGGHGRRRRGHRHGRRGGPDGNGRRHRDAGEGEEGRVHARAPDAALDRGRLRSPSSPARRCCG